MKDLTRQLRKRVIEEVTEREEEAVTGTREEESDEIERKESKNICSFQNLNSKFSMACTLCPFLASGIKSASTFMSLSGHPNFRQRPFFALSGTFWIDWDYLGQNWDFLQSALPIENFCLLRSKSHCSQ